jgi:hypothetical protein
MSPNPHESSDEGTMDLTEHKQMWALFQSLIRWVIGGTGLLLVFLAIFRTHN